MNATTRRATRLLASAALLAAVAAGARAEAPAHQRTTEADGSFQVAAIDDEAFGRLRDPGPKLAEGPSPLDLLRQTVEAYRGGDLAAAEALRPKLLDPAAVAVADWVAIRAGVALAFERIAAFRANNPDWPETALLRRRAEDALLSSRKPPAVLKAYFAKEPPVTGAGKVALALALKADGDEERAAALVRSAWREDGFGRETEGRILDNFPDLLTVADHRFRMERFLFKESWASGLRAAEFAGDDYVLLAKARIAAHGGGKKADKALAAVPEHLKADPSYRFSQALHLRRKEKVAEAARAIADVTRDPAVLVDGDEWWQERRTILRKLLDKGDAALAYGVARGHGAETNAQRIEAEFHAGWIALRFLDKPDAAAEHFAEAARIAETPISVSRAAYWQGRAAEAAGLKDEARRHYGRAAYYPITYYGQLARGKLGPVSVELRAPEPLDPEARKAFEGLRPVQALRLLHGIGADDLALVLYGEVAQTLGTAAALDALGALAAEQGNPRAVLAVGKTAVQRGFPLDTHAYPSFGIPEFPTIGDAVEQAMVYAITRQESAFNPKALSTAGARGLMQLMPATAKRTAKRFGVAFDVNRLTADPAYNAKIGAAHLGELMEDWRGNHILAFASYNAGGGNVAKWIRAYGDPRHPEVDPIDWVERIPFSETRNYVQRVMENLHVYRHRLQEAQVANPRSAAERSASALPPEEAPAPGRTGP